MFSSLSSHERSVIETMIKLNHSIREIARFLKRSPATISYEYNHGRCSSLTPEISAFLNHYIGISKWILCNQVKHVVMF